MIKNNQKDNVPYHVHPAVIMLEQWACQLPTTTGKSLPEWVQLVTDAGLTTAKEQREWLQKAHRLGANSARWIVERVTGTGFEDSDAASYLRHAPIYVENMFKNKPSLWPLYQAILEKVQQLGHDVRICPCKTIVPFYRNHVFAQAKTSTKDRLDLGLALANLPASDRLLSTGGLAKGDRITHRMALHGKEDLDGEVDYWLKVAYEQDAQGTTSRSR